MTSPVRFPDPNRSSPAASTLLVTLTALSALSFVAAFTLQRIAPGLRVAHQNAAWQESRIAAEAGVDAAISDLLQNTTGPSPKSWTGWKQMNDGLIGPALDTTLDLVNSLLSLLGSPAPASAPIFLDNVKIAGDLATEVDVQLWALRPAGSTRKWFRIRSMATCALPAAAYQAPDALEVALRRFNLRDKRARVRLDDVGLPSTVPLPNVSRAVEVLVEPVSAFELALWTAGPVSLPRNGQWIADSYDSRDPAKSNGGFYPGPGSAKAQPNAAIASNLGRPIDSPYGALIDAAGARVRGSVATNGGDDPATTAHENVAGAGRIAAARIRDDFHREMRPIARPPASGALSLPLLNSLSVLRSSATRFTPGSEAAPAVYQITGSLGAFSVDPPLLGTAGALVILLDGDLNVANGRVVIPPGVTVKLFVRGNVNFHSNSINADASSSRRPAQFQIYGDDSGAESRRIVAQDSATICAAFYGPNYDACIDGSVNWFGAIAARSFEAPYGGDGGLHYDEALCEAGPTVSFRIIRYVEDVRE